MNYKGSSKVVSFGLDKENNNVLQSTTNHQYETVDSEVSVANISFFIVFF